MYFSGKEVLYKPWVLGVSQSHSRTDTQSLIRWVSWLKRQTVPQLVRQIVSPPVSESVAGRIWKAKSDVSTKGTDYK